MSRAIKSEKKSTEKKAKWNKYALLLSVALNIVLITAVLVSYFMGKHGWKKRHHHGFAGIERVAGYMFKGYPEARRKQFMDIVRTHKADYEQLRQRRGQFRTHLKKVLGAEMFDTHKARQAFLKKHQTRGKRHAVVVDIIIDVMEKMTLEERKKFLQHRFFRRFLKNKHRH